MFAGGGAIPLEALRLGCEAYALDLNPSILTEDAEFVYFGPYMQYMSGVTDTQVKWTLENRSDNPGIRDGDMFLLPTTFK